jgi:Flp pilus assembly protein TadD
MTSRPGAVHPETMALAREAAALDARGALAQAIEAWARAAKRDPGFAPAQLGLAQALLRIGRVDEALPLLAAVTRDAPASAGAWLAYGVALSTLGRHDDAVAASARAASLAPRAAAVQLGHGDVLRQAGRHAAATDAYRAALALAPDDPDALNKTASMLRIGFRGDEAEALLRKAIARAPGHPLARVNLATLLIERGRPEGPEALRAAARIADLPVEARREVDDALASLAEREALAAPLAEALAHNDPAILAAAIRSRPSSGEADRAIVDVFATMAGRLRDARPIDGRFARGAPRSRDWPALEAHHNFLGPRTDEAIERTVRLVAAPPAAPSDVDLDYLRVARVVADPTVAAIDTADPASFEAWLRLRHAQLVGHRAEYAPGCFKLLNNLVADYPLVERTPWRQVVQTLRTIAVDLAPKVPAGPWREAFLYAAIVECHPFADGNGRVARLFVNRRLAAAGLFPHLRREGKDSAQVNMTREAGELEPLVEWLAAGSRYAAELDARWSTRTAA